MIISRKSIFRTVLLISLTIVTLVYGVTYLMDIEDVNTLTITENNNQICNSSTGVCTPPPGWYSTNN